MSKVFVAGATGVLGKRAVAQLVAAGHDVTGVARTPEKAELLRRLGARPVSVDIFDAAAVAEAVAGHDVVCNLATHIPPMAKAALPGAWSDNDRIRSEASRNLVDAALAAGASRYVQESISFICADGGDEWIDEDAPVEVVPYVRSVLEAEAQARRFTEAGGIGVVLRFAVFYGPDSHTTQTQLWMARLGIAPVLGAADGWQSSIETEDAASAVVAALRAPAGTYNVADDEPVTKRDWADVLAAALGSPRAVMTPRPALRVAGWRVNLLSRSHRISNRRFREATGWAPATPSVRQGLPALVAEVGRDVDEVGFLSRVLLALVGVSSLTLGVWASASPESFYDSFPFGRGWVSADGPYNEHLVRDFGGLNLGLALVLGAAAVTGRRLVAGLASVAALLFGAPHLVYHLRHLDAYDGFDKVANVVSLSLAVVAPALVLALLARRPRQAP